MDLQEDLIVKLAAIIRPNVFSMNWLWISFAHVKIFLSFKVPFCIAVEILEPSVSVTSLVFLWKIKPYPAPGILHCKCLKTY